MRGARRAGAPGRGARRLRGRCAARSTTSSAPPPRAELQAAHLAVLRGEAAAPPPGAPGRRRAQPAGRAHELRRPRGATCSARRELLARHRLVTLVGTGRRGQDPARARARGPQRQGTAWLVELAPLGDGESLAPARARRARPARGDAAGPPAGGGRRGVAAASTRSA